MTISSIFRNFSALEKKFDENSVLIDSDDLRKKCVKTALCVKFDMMSPVVEITYKSLWDWIWWRL